MVRQPVFGSGVSETPQPPQCFQRRTRFLRAGRLPWFALVIFLGRCLPIASSAVISSAGLKLASKEGRSKMAQPCSPLFYYNSAKVSNRTLANHGDTKVASVWHEWPGPGCRHVTRACAGALSGRLYAARAPRPGPSRQRPMTLIWPCWRTRPVVSRCTTDPFQTQRQRNLPVSGSMVSSGENALYDAPASCRTTATTLP